MDSDEQIAMYRKAYAQKSDSDLIHEMHRWVPHSEMHIAAKQLLEERRYAAQVERDKREDERHREIERRLDELRRPHWTVRPNFAFTVIGASAAVAAAIFGWLALRPAASVLPASSSPTQQQAPASPKP